MKYAALFGVFTTIVILLFIFRPDEATSSSHQTNLPKDTSSTHVIAERDTTPEYPFHKTDAEWREILTSKEYRILRERGTEMPYINEYNKNEQEGIYVCAGCGQKLFSSEHKYNSGTGWPSFWKPIADSLVGEREDHSFFMTRTEIVCSNCGGHIGHVFDDGPKPTGLRYCMNSAAMDFIEKEDVAGYEKKTGL